MLMGNTALAITLPVVGQKETRKLLFIEQSFRPFGSVVCCKLSATSADQSDGGGGSTGRVPKYINHKDQLQAGPVFHLQHTSQEAMS